MAPGSLPPGCWFLLLCVGCLVVVSCSGSRERNRSKKLKEKKSQWKEYPLGQGENLRLPASNDPEIVPESARYIDPHDAWMLFIKHSNKGVNSKKRSKGNSKKSKHQLPGLPGPPGPPGSQGPPGLPGALLTKEKMLQEFRLLLKVLGGLQETYTALNETTDNEQLVTINKNTEPRRLDSGNTDEYPIGTKEKKS